MLPVNITPEYQSTVSPNYVALKRQANSSIYIYVYVYVYVYVYIHSRLISLSSIM